MGEEQPDFEGAGPYGRARHAPLSLRWDGGRHHAALKERFGLSKTGSAMSLALLSEFDGRGRAISVSRSRDHYGRTPLRYRSALYQYRGVVEAFDHFADNGLIVADRAPPGRRGWQSSMKATPAFAEAIRETIAAVGKPRLLRPACNVIIRDQEGQVIDKPLTRDQMRMQRNLNEINEAIEVADIPDGQGGFLSRIFNENDRRGGRAFLMGGGFQSLKKQARLQLAINGEAVVEVDYKALHPSLLYAQAGIPMPEDPYELSRWHRDLVKRALLIVVNAKGEREAIAAVAHSAPMFDLIEPLRHDDPFKAAMAAAARLVRDIKQAHAPIAPDFHSDAGARLMRLDSDIAEMVMLDMLRQGIVVLSIHDSFLAPVSKVETLKAAMVRAAQMHGLPNPKVEVFSCNVKD